LKANQITLQLIALKNGDEAVVRILDKGYVTDKEYKKLLKAYSKTQLLHIKLVN
jgi:hypothetical protein